MKVEISIIVPVYNVEKYLSKCIDSILNQSFKEFEVILVDDGSTDRSSIICDEYSKIDNRVKVVHKKNGGVSSARNVGLDVAKGRYIGFVDSDDYIEADMYELLYDISEQNNCDITSCSSIIKSSNRTIVNGGHELLILDNRSEALRLMFQGELYDEVLWTKLFRKDVIGKIRFIEGQIYEDTSFTYKIIHKASKVATIGQAKYNYIKREGSIMDIGVKEKNLDIIQVYSDIYDFVSELYPELKQLVLLKFSNNIMTIMQLIIKENDFQKYKNEYYSISKILKQHFIETIKIKEYPRNVKILLILNKIHPLLYKNMISILNKRR